MRVCVFGAGAIGGFIAAALARSGIDVCVVARGAHLEAIRRTGLRVCSDLGDFTARVEASGDLRDFGGLDYVLLTFKSQQWDGVLPQFERAISEGSVFVTLQNGLPFWYSRERALQSVDPGGRILETVPYDRIIGGVVHASGHVAQPGFVRQSGGMLYPIGELDGAATPRVTGLSTAFANAGMSAPVEPEIRRNIWRKLVNNLALNPVSALTRATIQTMLSDPPVRALLHAIIEEGLAVARASGVEPGVDADERLKWAEHIADVKTSMLQDLEARRPLELEPIAGAALELARHYGVAVPHVETVYGLTKLLERSALRD
ncbi:MAG TPA: 2-dehydropantoate 2-reductase [Candidatus Baltobacteraceae bacterium]|nr:2-dehydropantoate 2-reductase [Candidatus Baltobacteraceae bacterium]